MKLYVVRPQERKTYLEVRDVAKKVDPYCIITVVESGQAFEFQSKLAADEVVRVMGGSMDTIEYDIRDLMK